MYRLLLDSSNRELAVGVAKDNVLIDEIRYEAWQRQSETMVSEVDKILKRNDVNRQDLESIVVSIGPGSYTGVRIALTIAKVISLALNIPIFTISSLAILKCHDKLSICLINARSNRSYVGIYSGSQVIVKDTIWTNDEVISYIKDNPNLTLCGDLRYLGLEGYSSSILEEMLSLSQDTIPLEDTLGLTPLYLKD